MSISFKVNGQSCVVDPSRGEEKLLDYLHEDLNLTGTKFCCGIGVCRACTVSMQKIPGEPATPVIACSTALQSIADAEITTIEGFSPDEGALLAIQEAYLDAFAFQCGYCAPGFVVASQIFLDRLGHSPVGEADLDAAIEDAIGSHICRCTGYARYYEALRRVAAALIDKAPQ